MRSGVLFKHPHRPIGASIGWRVMLQKQKRYDDARLNNADAELRSYTRLKKDIDRFRAHEAELRERLTSPRCGLGGGVGGGSSTIDPNGEQLAFLIDYSRKVDKLCIDAEMKHIEIYSRLMQIQEPQQTILKLYYLDGYGVEKISQNTFYSAIQVKRLKKEGLIKYSDTQ